MTRCCGLVLRPGMRHCAYCRRTIALIREGRCVSCMEPLDNGSTRDEGRCYFCRSRNVALSPSTRHLLMLAAKSRYKARAAA